jgi:rfaE bifunctional protein kinase chain/domain
MNAALDVAGLQRLLDRFPRLTIGLLGDLFLDRYLEIDGRNREWSIETGLEAYQVTRIRNSPGALGTVINNLVALEIGRIVPVTVIGDDGHGDDLMRCLANLPVDTSHVLRRDDRLTPTYTKPMLHESPETSRELHRLDVRSRTPLSRAAFSELAQHISATLAACDGWIVLDQVPEPDCGVVDHRTRRLLADLLKAHPEKLILIDSRKQLGEFHFGVLKGNRGEFLEAAGTASETDDNSLRRILQSRVQATGREAYCTIGERGMLVALPDADQVLHVPGVEVKGPLDIVGAGDAASGGLVATRLAGGDPWQAAWVGNLAASITVQQIGTTGVATRTQLIEQCRQATQD